MKNSYRTKKEFVFDLKKEILLCKYKFDKGSSLPDMIDDTLENNGVVFAVNKNGKSDKEIRNVHDVSFFYPIDDNLHQFRPFNDDSRIENNLLIIHAGYLLSVNQVSMNSTKNYSIVKTSPGVMRVFENLEPLSKALIKELKFPKGSK